MNLDYFIYSCNNFIGFKVVKPKKLLTDLGMFIMGIDQTIAYTNYMQLSQQIPDFNKYIK